MSPIFCRRLMLLALLAVFSAVAPELMAQPAGPPPNGPPPGDGSGGPPGGQFGGPWNPPRTREEGEQQYNRIDSMLREADANGNGMLEANEVTGRRQRMVERLLQRVGVPAKYPVSLDNVRKTLVARLTAAVEQASGKTPTGDAGAKPTLEGPTPAVAPAVPGFGPPASTTPAAAPVPGFGPPMTAAPVVAQVPGPAPSIPAVAPTPGSPADAERYRNYAKGLMDQYDKNHNGGLEIDECEAMSNNPKAADSNGDKAVSLDELIAWLSAGGKGGDSSKGPEGKNGNQKSSPYRIISSVDRLPTGLPSWFRTKDTDADGQVSMAEFSRDWSDARIAEFFSHDVNRDGVITPGECLQKDKSTKAKKGDDRKGGR